MRQIDPERIVETHFEQYLDEPGEWLGVEAIQQIVEEAVNQLPDVQLVVVTFDEDWQEE